MFSAGVHEADGGKKDTVANVEATGEFVYNMATWAQKDQMNQTALIVDRGVDEMAAAGLEPLPSRLVRPPRVKGSPVQFECRLHQIVTLPGRKPRVGAPRGHRPRRRRAYRRCGADGRRPRRRRSSSGRSRGSATRTTRASIRCSRWRSGCPKTTGASARASLLRLLAQRHRVDAEAQAARRRAVREHVAQVRVADVARRLDALHAVARRRGDKPRRRA